MNGVDKCDQMISSYDIQRKTQKWWKKLFFRLVELGIINAMIIFVKLFPDMLPKRRRHRVFRTVLIHEFVQPLIDEKNDKVSDGRQSDIPDIRLKLSLIHI